MSAHHNTLPPRYRAPRYRVNVSSLCARPGCQEDLLAPGLCPLHAAIAAAEEEEAQPQDTTPRPSKSVARSLPVRLATLERGAPGWQFGIVASNATTGEMYVRHSHGFAAMVCAAPLLHVISRAPTCASTWMEALCNDAALPNHKQAQASQVAGATSIGETVHGVGERCARRLLLPIFPHPTPPPPTEAAMMTMLTMEAGKIVHDSEWGQFTSATLDKDEEAGGLAPALGALPTPQTLTMRRCHG